MIQPTIFPTGGIKAALFTRMVDLDRRVTGLEGARGFLNGLDGSVIAAGSIPGTTIIAGTITSTQIVAGGITTAALAAGSVTAAIIAAGAINASHIQAGSITANELAANSVTAVKIAANVITATHIQSGSLTTTTIAAGAITTALLAAGAVTSDKITVSTLSAITTNIGSVTSGTIQGATIQTASSGSRVVIDSLGIRGYALNGTTKVFEVATGTGIASFTGIANIDPTSVIPGGTITTNTLPGDRIVTGSIQTLQIAAGAITANTIAAGAVTAQKLSISFGGANMLQNSLFSYYTGVATETSSAAWVNLCTNPSAEADLAGWITVQSVFLITGAAVTQDFTQAYSGAASVKVVTPATTATGGGLAIPGTFTTQPYTIAFYIRGAVGGETLTAFFGSPTGTTNYAFVTPTVTSTGWTRITITWTPNAQVSDVFLSVRTSSAVARTFFIDGIVCVAGSSVPAYFDGSTDPLAVWNGTPHASTSRLTSITGDPGVINGRLINRVGNPSLEVDTFGWTATAGGITAGATISRVTTQATRGSASLQVVTPATTGTGASYAMGVLPAGTYAWSLDVRCNTAATGLSVYAGPFSGTGGTTTAVTAGTTFARFSGTFTADGTSNQVIAVKVASAIVRTFHVDAVSVVLAPVAPDYFDGSTAGGAWVGVAQASMSWLPDSPGYWQHYDNGGTGGAVWQKVENGGPNGEESWKVTYSGISAAKGFMSGVQYQARPLTSYVLSFWWKGSTLPTVTGNHSFDLDFTWLLQPAASTSTWQRYAIRLKSTAGGTSGLDNIFIYGPTTGSGTSELADVQYEEGETLSPFSPAGSELLPYSVGNTTLLPNSVTTDKILAGTIQGVDIAASTITATNMNVSQLSAIAADMGTLTSGSISVPALTGARIVLDGTGFRQYAADGTTIQVNIPASGAAADFAGHINSSGVEFLSATTFTFPVGAASTGITWHSTTFAGAKLGYMTNVALAGSSTTMVQGIAASALLAGAGQIRGTNFAGTLSTTVTATQTGTAASNGTKVALLVENLVETLLDATDASTFMRRADGTASTHKMRYGQTSVAANTFVDVGIGFAPANVQLTARALGFPGGLSALNYDYQGANTIRIYNVNAFVVPFDWLAIG